MSLAEDSDSSKEAEDEDLSVSEETKDFPDNESLVMSDGDEWVETYPAEDCPSNDDPDHVVMEAVLEQDTSRLHVFSKLAKARVDKLAKELHRHLAWQSDPDLPRTSFLGGITKLAKMSGNERTGVLLLLLIILTMEHWAYFRRPVNKAKKKGKREGFGEWLS